MVATRTCEAPLSSQMRPTSRTFSSTAGSSPSTSISKTASTSVGRPKDRYCSTARIQSRSISSMVAGVMPALRMMVMMRAASSMRGNMAMAVLLARGFGTNRTSTSVTMPSVPSEPTNSWVRL